MNIEHVLFMRPQRIPYARMLSVKTALQWYNSQVSDPRVAFEIAFVSEIERRD